MIFEAGFGLALKVELMTANCEVNVVDEGRVWIRRLRD